MMNGSNIVLNCAVEGKLISYDRFKIKSFSKPLIYVKH